MKTTRGIFTALISATLCTACATSTLIKKDYRHSSTTIQVNLVEDQVVAFGRPATRTDPNLTLDSLVIAGYKHSYVLTRGGTQFLRLMSQLDSKNIQVTRELRFYAKQNDGQFSGTLPLTYVKLKQDISKNDLQFFIENGAKECSTASDERMQAQRFCFDIQLVGMVYPVANNLQSLQALSKPYQVTIYTQQQQRASTKSGMNPLEKLALFPFAVAIDVVSLPFQAAEKIFN